MQKKIARMQVPSNSPEEPDENAYFVNIFASLPDLHTFFNKSATKTYSFKTSLREKKFILSVLLL